MPSPPILRLGKHGRLDVAVRGRRCGGRLGLDHEPRLEGHALLALAADDDLIGRAGLEAGESDPMARAAQVRALSRSDQSAVAVGGCRVDRVFRARGRVPFQHDAVGMHRRGESVGAAFRRLEAGRRGFRAEVQQKRESSLLRIAPTREQHVVRRRL